MNLLYCRGVVGGGGGGGGGWGYKQFNFSIKWTYKREIIIHNLKVVWVGYRGVLTVLPITRATDGVAHAVKPVKPVTAKHLLAVVAKANQTHTVT